MFEFSSDQMYPYNLSRPMPMPMPMSAAAAVDRRWKPVVEIAPNCPRCDSSNTKFCYYNNYSLTQPRYFCKGCRRYWTKGGSLRNIPVGGGCRKNRRAKSVRSLSSINTSSAASRRTSASDSLRPADLALDDMVGGSTSNRSIDASSPTTNVPNIDLAILYSKFLSHEQQPPRSDDDDQGLAIPADHQTFHDLVGSSSGSGQAGLMGDEFSYGFDPSGTSYEPLALDPTALDRATDVFSTNCHQLFQNFPWQAPEQLLQAAGFCPGLDIDISSHHHHQDLIDNDWCTSIDQSSFGAF